MQKQKAGIAPGPRFWIVRSSRTMVTKQVPQSFDARFGGEAGHDLISAS